jgi:hypothetical protein
VITVCRERRARGAPLHFSQRIDAAAAVRCGSTMRDVRTPITTYRSVNSSQTRGAGETEGGPRRRAR